jgi:hypothetical protein
MNITGFVVESIVPVRRDPAHTSEMVNQLLFGELVQIIEWKGTWYYIRSYEDGYHGWVLVQNIQRVSEAFMQPDQPYRLISVPAAPVEITREDEVSRTFLPQGSIFPEFHSLEKGKQSCTVGDTTFVIDSQYLTPTLPFTREAVIETAKGFLNVPYLWGGKTHFGADCSGFVQTVFRMHGRKLHRDSWQQASQGKIKNFTERLPGDLAFFRNGAGRIIHVGLLVTREKIIHASGRVQIDFLTQKGIFNLESQKCTHSLHSIQSLF